MKGDRPVPLALALALLLFGLLILPGLMSARRERFSHRLTASQIEVAKFSEVLTLSAQGPVKLVTAWGERLEAGRAVVRLEAVMPELDELASSKMAGNRLAREVAKLMASRLIDLTLTDGITYHYQSVDASAGRAYAQGEARQWRLEGKVRVSYQTTSGVVELSANYGTIHADRRTIELVSPQGSIHSGEGRAELSGRQLSFPFELDRFTVEQGRLDFWRQGEHLTLEAEQVELVRQGREDRLIAEGKVSLKLRDLAVSCAKLTVEFPARRAVAEGGVVISGAQGSTRARSVVIDFSGPEVELSFLGQEETIINLD